MKNLIRTLTLILITEVLTACPVDLCRKIKKPKDVKPIDWENYNSVYDVFWNYHTCCRDIEIGVSIGKIKVYGWLHSYPENNVYELRKSDDPRSTGCILQLHDGHDPELIPLLNAIQSPRKCYIQGDIYLDCYNPARAVADILIQSVNDIRFEE